MIFSLLVLTVGLAVAQDTYSCPDGWMKEVKRKSRIVMDEVGEENIFMEQNSLFLWDEGGEGCLWKRKSRIVINEVG